MSYIHRPRFPRLLTANVKHGCIFMGLRLEAVWKPMEKMPSIISRVPERENGITIRRPCEQTHSPFSLSTGRDSRRLPGSHSIVSSAVLNHYCVPRTHFDLQCDRGADHGDNVRYGHQVPRRQVFASCRTGSGVPRERRSSWRVRRRYIPDTYVHSRVSEHLDDTKLTNSK